jgi:hypothetical protein
MSSGPIYLELSDKLRQVLASRHVDLQTELNEAGVEAHLRGISLKGRPKARDPYLVILAAGVTASLVGGAVSRIVAAVSSYKHAQMKERDLRVALDGTGAAIIDKEGDPVYEVMETPVEAPAGEVSATRLIAGKLVTFDVSTGNRSTDRAKARSPKQKRKSGRSKRKTGKKRTN